MRWRRRRLRRRADPRVDRVLICTPDKDLAQCVRGTRVVQLDRRTRMIRDEAGVVAKFGVPPASIPDYLALVGDAAKALVYNGPGQRAWQSAPQAGRSRTRRCHCPHHDVHDLRHRPSHPEGRRADRDARPHSRPRGHRRHRGGRRQVSAFKSATTC